MRVNKNMPADGSDDSKASASTSILSQTIQQTHSEPMQGKDPFDFFASASQQPYQFNPDDEFYMAPPACQFLHYRNAAVVVGVLEVMLLIGALVTSLDFYLTTRLVGIWAPLLLSGILCIAIGTTVVMIYGVLSEQAQMLWPQMYFLKVEITLLMAGAVFSIASMCLGIESTNLIFSHFVSVPQMEKQFGPIWPFNVAIMSFVGAALGIWFDVIMRGCYDYLLDKEYFSQGPQPIQIASFISGITSGANAGERA